ncbi:hypothetical protein FACS1894178_0380 [Bacteroidia bacterium]|nr:hypothetical protein FACS1894178_0380 [Bacteroidia bacterium]
MKTKLYLLALLLLCGFGSFSQNYTSNIEEEDWLCVYPNKKTYFDFQIGDELHIRHLTSSFMYYYLEQKTILKYFSRSDYQDSIIYHINVQLIMKPDSL